jgi:hypothetical protein
VPANFVDHGHSSILSRPVLRTEGGIRHSGQARAAGAIDMTVQALKRDTTLKERIR